MVSALLSRMGLANVRMRKLNRSRVFVVNDELRLAKFISRLLESAGYPVDIATDSREALKVLVENPAGYAVLITDNRMPHLPGDQLTQKVRKAGFCGKIIMFSASVSVEEEPEFKAMGMDEILRKPFEFRMLVPTVEKLCGNARLDEGEVR